MEFYIRFFVTLGPYRCDIREKWQFILCHIGPLWVWFPWKLTIDSCIGDSYRCGFCEIWQLSFSHIWLRYWCNSRGIWQWIVGHIGTPYWSDFCGNWQWILGCGCGRYYGDTLAETVLGKALKTMPIPRESFVVSTKCGRYGHTHTGFDFSAERVTRSVDESLERLNLDYVDIMICHDIEFVSLDQVLNFSFFCPFLRDYVTQWLPWIG